MSASIKLYSVFHLNIKFSSIEESEHSVLLQRCYWPLLNLISDGYSIGIEASGITLERIQELDPEWIRTLKRYVEDGRCEFIGSGYAQLIGPLVPHQVNRQNQKHGLDVYQKLLGIKPKLVLVNEMAYSSGLVDVYLEAGYDAILMDWANPYSQHTDVWKSDWRYFPQKALGASGKTIALIWLDTVPFQRFQRYVHGEIGAEDLVEFISSQSTQSQIAFPLYGNDVEIFDYRPGRFKTEPPIDVESEWGRIRDLLEMMSHLDGFDFVKPSEVLSLNVEDNNHEPLQLQSPDDPVPVKKQPKYNIIRWAATGRDDVWVNTACWRVFKNLLQQDDASEEEWRNLCRLWGSDCRTHITQARWRDYNLELANAGAYRQRPSVFKKVEDALRHQMQPHNSPFTLKQERRTIKIGAPCGTLNLRSLRGLSIEGFWPQGDEQSIYRTLPQGYFSDINWAADFYSGHMIAQVVGQPQVTDLEKVVPSILFDPDHRFVDVEASIETLSGPLFKRIRFFADVARVEVSYRINWMDELQGSVHFANLTLNPAGFDRRSLFYAVHNGGVEWEKHSLAEKDVDHMRAPSFLVSSRAGMGMTEGKIIIGDKQRQLLIECPREIAAMPALIKCKTVETWKGPSFFCRVVLSAREIDDTANCGLRLPVPGRSEYTYSVTALSDGEPLKAMG